MDAAVLRLTLVDLRVRARSTGQGVRRGRGVISVCTGSRKLQDLAYPGVQRQ